MKKERGNKSKYSTISIPYPLAEKIKETIKDTGYVSSSDFVTDILRTVLVMKKVNKSKKEKKASLNDDERDFLKQRLKSLGYLK